MQERMEIRETQQIKAALHPLRRKIMGWLAENSPATPSQVARAIGTAANKVHYHMRILEKAGLVHLVETRQVGAVTELYFAAAARSYLISPSVHDEGFNMVLDAAAAEMKQLLIDFRRLGREPEDAPPGQKASLVYFSRLRAESENQADIDNLAGNLKAAFARAAERYPGRLYRLAVLLVPTEEDENGGKEG